MKKKIVAGNWKMNKNLDEGIKLTSEIATLIKDAPVNGVEIIIVPPFTHLTDLNKLLQDNDQIRLGAQNCNENNSGAYTGEISAAMLKSSGVDYVVIGHSERRTYFNESDELLATKVSQALINGLTPIYCCGEPLSVRESNSHEDYVFTQISNGLFHLSQESFGNVVIAYEPIWAIGTGVTASAAQAQEMHKAIRNHLASKYGHDAAGNCSILYGGSCKPSNAKELFALADVDGGLIGGASLNPEDFVGIIRSF